MQLTAQQLGQVVAAFHQLEHGGRGESQDKRRHTRVLVNGRVDLAATVDSAGALPWRYSGLARDVAFGGMGLIQSLVVREGVRFVVCLPVGGNTMLVLSEATHCTLLAHGIYAVGAKFVEAVGPEFLANLAKARGDEERIKSAILG